jgi:hypothetical protein
MPAGGRRSRLAVRPGRMRYTKIALLIFGLGMIAGLVIVAGEFPAWERAASAVMALGLVLVPLALFADGHGMALVRWLAARLSPRRRTTRRTKARAAAARLKKPVRGAARPAGRARRPNPSR